jgi:hypothetical protein
MAVSFFGTWGELPILRHENEPVSERLFEHLMPLVERSRTLSLQRQGRSEAGQRPASLPPIGPVPGAVMQSPVSDLPGDRIEQATKSTSRQPTRVPTGEDKPAAPRRFAPFRPYARPQAPAASTATDTATKPDVAAPATSELTDHCGRETGAPHAEACTTSSAAQTAPDGMSRRAALLLELTRTSAQMSATITGATPIYQPPAVLKGTEPKPSVWLDPSGRHNAVRTEEPSLRAASYHDIAARFVLDNFAVLPVNAHTAALLNTLLDTGEVNPAEAQAMVDAPVDQNLAIWVGDSLRRLDTDLCSDVALQLQREDPVAYAEFVHQRVVTLHAFIGHASHSWRPLDENGRTARLMAALVLLKAGLPPPYHRQVLEYFNCACHGITLGDDSPSLVPPGDKRRVAYWRRAVAQAERWLQAQADSDSRPA